MLPTITHARLTRVIKTPSTPVFGSKITPPIGLTGVVVHGSVVVTVLVNVIVCPGSVIVESTTVENSVVVTVLPSNVCVVVTVSAGRVSVVRSVSVVVSVSVKVVGITLISVIVVGTYDVVVSVVVAVFVVNNVTVVVMVFVVVFVVVVGQQPPPPLASSPLDSLANICGETANRTVTKIDTINKTSFLLISIYLATYGANLSSDQ
jgi:hypothetical protein